MSQIFDKTTRKNATDPDLTMSYIKVLEDIAKAAVVFWEDQSTNNVLVPFSQLPASEQKLMNALDKVDWMRE